VATGQYLVTLGSRLASIVSTRRQDYTYAPVIRSPNRCANTSKKKIYLRPVSLCRVNSHTTRGSTADSTHLANDTVHSRGYCLDLRRKLRCARDSLRTVRSRRSFRTVLSKVIAMCTAMCSRGAGQCGRACSLTCPADLLARVPAMCSQGTCVKEAVSCATLGCGCPSAANRLPPREGTTTCGQGCYCPLCQPGRG